MTRIGWCSRSCLQQECGAGRPLPILISRKQLLKSQLMLVILNIFLWNEQNWGSAKQREIELLKKHETLLFCLLLLII